MPLGDQPHLIIDIGGGSVEFIVGDEKRAAMLESRKLGAARMTARYVKSDPISKEDLRAIHKHFDTELSQLIPQIKNLAPVAAMGTSGTLENIAAMCGSTEESDISFATIERDAFDKLMGELIDSDTKSRSKIKGLDDQRKDQIVAGALLVGEVFERLNLKRITLCPAALREGILLEYLNRHSPELQIRRDIPDPRRRAVLDLVRKYDWHQKHSEQVTTLCMALFDQLKPLHKLGTVERELIEYAALMHDIGWHISGKSHHKHSLYLIRNGGLRDFTKEEIDVMANIARYHRKSAPREKHPLYAELSSRGRKVVDVGAALLRVADGLDRSHASVIKGLHSRITDDEIRCRLDARSDAELEIWGARRKMKWLEEVFGKKLILEMSKK
jgi:exopolyphosphatase/guanosine-5'-triphosphate,3'-diphosphate pyrophosphatase